MATSSSVGTAPAGIMRRGGAKPAAASPPHGQPPVPPQHKPHAHPPPLADQPLPAPRMGFSLHISSPEYKPLRLQELLKDVRGIVSGANTTSTDPVAFTKLWRERTPDDVWGVTEALINVVWRYAQMSLDSQRYEIEARLASTVPARYPFITKQLDLNLKRIKELGNDLKIARERCITSYRDYEDMLFDMEMAYLKEAFGSDRIVRAAEISAVSSVPEPPQSPVLTSVELAPKASDSGSVRAIKEVAAAVSVENEKALALTLARTGGPTIEEFISSTTGKRLSSIVNISKRPDNNLGQQEVGPSREKVTYQSLVKLLLAMGVDSKSVFFDIGCAHGLVVFGAVMLFNAARGFGIDLATEMIDWANGQKRARLNADEKGRIDFFAGDVMVEWSGHRDLFNSATHVYAFSKDFPANVIYYILAMLYENRKRWRIFASGRSAATMLKLIDDAAEKNKVAPRPEVMQYFINGMAARPDTVQVNLQFSGEGHSIYLFDNKGA
jgi:hypothetical protein